MPIDFNECLYLNGEKDNAFSMLKECINGDDELTWPCTDRIEMDKDLLSHITERPNGDNVGGKLPHSLDELDELSKENGSDDIESFNNDNIEGFTNMGASYVRPGWVPDGYFKCPKTGKVKQLCQNCKYNQKTYGKSKEFNEADPCFPNRGVYDGVDNRGVTKCTCGQRGQYCNEIFDAQGGMFADDIFVMNVGNFGSLGSLAAY